MKTKALVNHPLDESIEQYWSLNLKMLAMTGLKTSVKETEEIKENKLMNKLPVFIANISAMCLAIMELQFAVCNITRNKYIATQACSHFCANVLCISKGNRMAVSINELQILLRDVAGLWRKYLPRGENRQQFLAIADSTSMFCKCFVMVTLGATFSFLLSPLQNVIAEYRKETVNYTYIYSQRPLIHQYPFPIQNSKVYLFVILEEEILILISGLFWVCCDTLFAQLTSHISLQIQILKHDIHDLINSECLESRLKRNFKSVVKRHNQILRICNQVEDIFSPIILSTVLLSGINICINVFQLREMVAVTEYAIAAVHALLLTNTFLQIIFYCTFAEALTQQTNSIAYAIYSSNWTEKNHVFKAYIQMLVIRSQSPFYCTGCGFFPINHRRLTMVINTAFSYYMMLQTSSNK